MSIDKYDSVPPWDENNERMRPQWLPADSWWIAPTRRYSGPSKRLPGLTIKLAPAPVPIVAPVVDPYGPESEGNPNDPILGAGCGVDD